MEREINGNNEKSYRMRVYPIDADTDEIEWVAEFPDLPGCVGAGETAEEAVTMAIDAQRAWINVALEEGRNIPEPINPYESDYSGKFTLRLPKTLHRELVLQAEDEGISLNQYILYLVSRGLNKETSAAKETSKQTYKLSMMEFETAIESWEKPPISIEHSTIINNLAQKNRRF